MVCSTTSPAAQGRAWRATSPVQVHHIPGCMDSLSADRSGVLTPSSGQAAAGRESEKPLLHLRPSGPHQMPSWDYRHPMHTSTCQHKFASGLSSVIIGPRGLLPHLLPLDARWQNQMTDTSTDSDSHHSRAFNVTTVCATLLLVLGQLYTMRCYLSLSSSVTKLRLTDGKEFIQCPN